MIPDIFLGIVFGVGLLICGVLLLGHKFIMDVAKFSDSMKKWALTIGAALVLFGLLAFVLQ